MDRRLAAWATNTAILLVGGSVTMFIAFFFAYAFSDELDWSGEHAAFLAIVALVAGTWGLLLGLLDTAILEVRLRIGVAFGLLTSLAIHLTALAVGTAVSFGFEDQGSITADQARIPFVVLIVVCAALAVATARAATTLARPAGSAP